MCHESTDKTPIHCNDNDMWRGTAGAGMVQNVIDKYTFFLVYGALFLYLKL